MKHNPGATHLGAPTSWDAALRIWARMASLALPLTMLSALLYLVGTWSPWAYEFATPASGHGSGTTGSILISGSDVVFGGLLALLHYQPSGSDFFIFDWYQALFYAWDALPLCGIVLSLALWQRRTQSHALLGVYAGWLVFATAVTGVGLYRAFAVLAGDQCAPDCSSPVFIIYHQVAWGVWLTLCALVLAWVSLGTLMQRRTDLSTDRRTASSPVPRTPPRTLSRSTLLGPGAYTLGVALWALGLLLVPWVTVGCSGLPLSLTHFARGSCQGLDGYDVLIAGLIRLGWEGAYIPAMYWDALHIIELLLIAGVVLTVLLWRPGRARSMPVAVTVWMILVTLVFLVGWQGTTGRLGHPAALVFAPAALWVMGPGIWLCAAGILLAWAGTGAEWLHARMRDEQNGSHAPAAP